jgi:hypothetical protein
VKVAAAAGAVLHAAAAEAVAVVAAAVKTWAVRLTTTNIRTSVLPHQVTIFRSKEIKDSIICA